MLKLHRNSIRLNFTPNFKLQIKNNLSCLLVFCQNVLGSPDFSNISVKTKQKQSAVHSNFTEYLGLGEISVNMKNNGKVLAKLFFVLKKLAHFSLRIFWIFAYVIHSYFTDNISHRQVERMQLLMQGVACTDSTVGANQNNDPRLSDALLFIN